MLSKLFYFLKRDFLEAASYKFAFVFSFFGIFLSSSTFFFISKLISGNTIPMLAPYGGDYFAFVIVGLACSELLQVFESSLPGEIRSAQVTGTLESIFLTRTSLLTILTGISLYPLLFTLLRVAFYFVLGIAVFGIKLGTINWIANLLVIFLGSICFLSIGILSASFIMVYKTGNPFSFVFGTISGLLGGVFFPVTILPPWIKWLSYLLPITHTLEGVRHGMLSSSSFAEILPSILSLSIFAALLFPLSLFIFRLAVKKAKKDGVLSQY
jgi:ABC-2 type transport system permease protein